MKGDPCLELSNLVEVARISQCQEHQRHLCGVQKSVQSSWNRIDLYWAKDDLAEEPNLGNLSDHESLENIL